MAPRLSGQTSIFGVVFFVSKSLLGIERQKKLEKFAILTRKPRNHARILIYRTRPIVKERPDRAGLGRPSKRFTFQHGGKNNEGKLIPFISYILFTIAC